MKYLGLEIHDLCIQILAAKITLFCLKTLPYRINFLAYFSIQYIHIQRIFKTMSYFFPYFTGVFQKSGIISSQELLLNHILKECLISKDLQIIKKKADIFLIDVYLRHR